MNASTKRLLFWAVVAVLAYMAYTRFSARGKHTAKAGAGA